MCTNCYLEIVESFTWAQVPETMHNLLAHTPQLMEENDYRGLGGWSEEGLERMNAAVKRDRKDRARKTNTYDNLKDVVNHGFHCSSPKLTRLDKKRKRRNPRLVRHRHNPAAKK